MARLVEASHAGWFRQGAGQPWEKVAEGDSQDGAMAATIDFLKARTGRGGDTIVLPIDQHPGNKGGRR
jgi:hypothetical protein